MGLGLRVSGKDVDLFKEENVILNALTKDFKDPSKVFSDYSQQFTVPGSKNNNKIFKHFYMVDLNHSIDIRKTIQAELTINTRFFRSGRVVVLGANMVNGVIDSYRLQFIGELSSLTSALEDKDINEIDYSDLKFDYTRKNIGDRLTYNGGVNNNVVFTLLNSQIKYFWDSEQTIPEEDNYKNLFKGMDYLNLSPSISVEYILNKIASASNLSFKISDSIKSILNSMYLFCDASKEGIDEDIVEMLWNNDYTIVTYPKSVFRVTNISLSMNIFDDAKDFLYRVYAVEQGSNEVVLPKSKMEYKKGNYTFNFNLRGDGRLIFYVASKYPMNFSCNASGEDIGQNQSGQVVILPFSIGSFRYTSNSATYNAGVYLPEISQIDFVSSIVKMLNLVIIPDGNIYNFLTYKEWRSRGVVWDIGNNIDITKYEIDRQELPSSFDFSFNENNSMLMEQYRDINGRSYGDLKYTVEDKEFYTSEDKEVSLAFDNAVFERLINQETGVLTQVQYGYLEEKQKLIHYVVNVSISKNNINIGGMQNDPYIAKRLNIPSHLQEHIGYYNSLVFGREIDEYVGVVIENTLFKNNYSDEVSKIYHKDTRNLKITAIVPTTMLLNIKNEDKLLISGSVWEIERMSINLTNNKIDFELSFYKNTI